MEVEGLPGCCNAVIIHGFGNAPHAQRLRYGDDADPDTDDQKQFVAQVIEDHGNKLIVATTNSYQTNTMKILKERGFQRTKSMSKPRHMDSKLIMWWRRPGGD
jgi:hypothetical protein